MSTEPTIEAVREAILEAPQHVARVLADLIAALGAKREWSMEDNFQTTEAIAMLADTLGLPSAGDQNDEDIAFWREIAKARGLDYDDEDETIGGPVTGPGELVMKPSNDKEAIGLIAQGLVDAGVRLMYVNDGEEEIVVRDSSEAVEAVTAVDDAILFVRLPDGARGWILFVLGNDPEEVAADYTVNLGSVIEPIVHPWWS